MKTVADSLLNDLGVAASIVIVAGGIFGVYQAAIRIYSRTVGSRRDLARRLNELAAGVTLRYVEERFGTPAFSRTIALPRQPSAGAVRPQKKTLREIALVVAGAGATTGSTQTATGQAHAHDGAPCDGQSFRELVFREKHAWVQVLADDNDAVARFLGHRHRSTVQVPGQGPDLGSSSGQARAQPVLRCAGRPARVRAQSPDRRSQS